MSDNNYKGKLQELLQKRKQDLPKYDTREVSNGIFASSIRINDYSYVGFMKKSKGEAERSVAEIAFKSLTRLPTLTISLNSTRPNRFNQCKITELLKIDDTKDNFEDIFLLNFFQNYYSGKYSEIILDEGYPKIISKYIEYLRNNICRNNVDIRCVSNGMLGFDILNKIEYYNK